MVEHQGDAVSILTTSHPKAISSFSSQLLSVRQTIEYPAIRSLLALRYGMASLDIDDPKLLLVLRGLR